MKQGELVLLDCGVGGEELAPGDEEAGGWERGEAFQKKLQ
jgi:hypothetical protein